MLEGWGGGVLGEGDPRLGVRVHRRKLPSLGASADRREGTERGIRRQAEKSSPSVSLRVALLADLKADRERLPPRQGCG